MRFLHFDCWVLEGSVALFEVQQLFGLQVPGNYSFVRFFSSRFMEFHSTHADWYSSIDSRGSLCVFLELRLSVTPSSLVICFQLFQPPQLLHTPNSSCGKCTRGLELGLPAPGFRNCFRQKATVTEHLPLLFLSSNSPVLMVVQYLKTCFV